MSHIFLNLGVLTASMLTSSNSAASLLEDPNRVTATYGHYYYYSDGMAIVKDAEGDWVASNGETGAFDFVMNDVRYCSAKSSMICMVGDDEGIFAVPRKELAANESWTFGGAVFRVLPCVTAMVPGGRLAHMRSTIEMRILGVDVSFYVIARMGADGKYPVRLFYFSPERGLIGKAMPAEAATINAPLLQEAYGPGSPQFDSKISSGATLSDAEFKKLLNEPLVKRELPGPSSQQ